MVPRRIVLGLGITQIVGYGTLYYAYSILAASIGQEFGVSLEWLYGVFSASLLAGALAAPWTGRCIGRFGAGRLMVLGSILASLALALLSRSPNSTIFIAALVAVQVISMLVLFDAAFPAVVQIAGQGARREITQITLITSFASTVFWPATSLLHDVLSWRDVYLVFSGLHLMVCLPIHLMIARLEQGSSSVAGKSSSGARDPERGRITDKDRGTGFVLMAISFSLGSFMLAAIQVHMVPVLAALGLSAAAVYVGALFGPAQVLARLGEMMLGRQFEPTSVAMFAAALLPISILALIVGAPSLAAAALFTLLFGVGSGLAAIVRGALPLSLFGSTGYAERLGWLTSVRLVVSSTAPFAFAVALEQYGILVAMWLIAFVGLLSLLTVIALAYLAQAGRAQ